MFNHPSPTFFKSILSMNWKSFPESLKFSFKVNLLDLLIQLLNLLDFPVFQFVTTYTLLSSSKVNIKSDQFTVAFLFFLIISCTITRPSLIRHVKNCSQITTTALSIDIHHPPSLSSSWKSKQTKLLPLKSAITARRHIQW